MTIKQNIAFVNVALLILFALSGCTPIMQAKTNTSTTEIAVSNSSGIPEGFILVDEIKQSPYWTLDIQLSNERIYVINAYGTCVFETEAADTSFIIESEGQFYVAKAKLEELMFGPVIVHEVPQGYVALQEIINRSDVIASYLFFENMVSLLDAQDVSIYQTLANDVDFIVCCDRIYYVNEDRIQEIVSAQHNH